MIILRLIGISFLFCVTLTIFVFFSLLFTNQDDTTLILGTIGFAFGAFIYSLLLSSLFLFFHKILKKTLLNKWFVFFPNIVILVTVFIGNILEASISNLSVTQLIILNIMLLVPSHFSLEIIKNIR